VIVVSEETGSITVAENGRLIRNLTVEALESLLLEMLAKSTSAFPARKSQKEELMAP
jgi:hypothetical protein